MSADPETQAPGRGTTSHQICVKHGLCVAAEGDRDPEHSKVCQDIKLRDDAAVFMLDLQADELRQEKSRVKEIFEQLHKRNAERDTARRQLAVAREALEGERMRADIAERSVAHLNMVLERIIALEHKSNATASTRAASGDPCPCVNQAVEVARAALASLTDGVPPDSFTALVDKAGPLPTTALASADVVQPPAPALTVDDVLAVECPSLDCTAHAGLPCIARITEDDPGAENAVILTDCDMYCSVRIEAARAALETRR